MLNIRFTYVDEANAIMAFRKGLCGLKHKSILRTIGIHRYYQTKALFNEAFYLYYEYPNLLKKPCQFCNIRWYRTLNKLKKHGWIKVYRVNNKMVYEIPIYVFEE